jgi:CheY-like chemotaxis protein
MVFVDATDTGIGIEPALLAKVFEPFFTTKPVGQGTGLGLSQVYGLCQRAGGLADVRSEPGRGTTVRLYFPAASQPPEAIATLVPAQQRHLGLRILFVEDNDEVAAALIQVLDAMGCSVQRFDRASPAFEWLSTQTQLPDLLLSDVVMPGPMDGAALAQKVRAAHPGLRILLMTGYAQQIETITRLGFEVLPKPCSAERLAEALG